MSAPDLPLLHRGKVRDVYDAGGGRLLMVASDRLSAFDVVLPDEVPGKGEILTQLSHFWFAKTAHLCRNHLTGVAVHEVVPDPAVAAALARRAVVVERLEPLPIEAVVRGYLIGSGWRDYRQSGRICGLELPPDLPLAARLPEPIYTPSTKASAGRHDENIDYDATVSLLGVGPAATVRDKSLELYRFAAAYALECGIIIADCKLEFGLDSRGAVVLMDEIFTPDAARFWPADRYRPGTNPPSFDKQYVRDYLETLKWDKKPPGPHLPPEVIHATFARYAEAYQRLTGRPWPPAVGEAAEA